MKLEDKYEGFVTPENGELTFNNQVEEDMFRDFLRSFDGEKLWLTVESKSPTRTSRQNRFYWAYLEKIAQQSGYMPEELHHTFKRSFIQTKEVNGISRTFQERPTTTDMTTKEFSEYIDKIKYETEISPPSLKRYGLSKQG